MYLDTFGHLTCFSFLFNIKILRLPPSILLLEVLLLTKMYGCHSTIGPSPSLFPRLFSWRLLFLPIYAMQQRVEVSNFLIWIQIELSVHIPSVSPCTWCHILPRIHQMATSLCFLVISNSTQHNQEKIVIIKNKPSRFLLFNRVYIRTHTHLESSPK